MQKRRRNGPTPLGQYLSRWNAWFRRGLVGLRIPTAELGNLATCIT